MFSSHTPRPSVPDGSPPDLAVVEVDVELFSPDDPAAAPRRSRVRILVDAGSGAEVSFGDRILHGYHVVDIDAGLFGRGPARVMVVEDAPHGCPSCASLWTDDALDAGPAALRLTAGRVGETVETLVLGEGEDGGLDGSASFDVTDPDGGAQVLRGTYRVERVRRMRPH